MLIESNHNKYNCTKNLSQLFEAKAIGRCSTPFETPDLEETLYEDYLIENENFLNSSLEADFTGSLEVNFTGSIFKQPVHRNQQQMNAPLEADQDQELSPYLLERDDHVINQQPDHQNQQQQQQNRKIQEIFREQQLKRHEQNFLQQQQQQQQKQHKTTVYCDSCSGIFFEANCRIYGNKYTCTSCLNK